MCARCPIRVGYTYRVEKERAYKSVGFFAYAPRHDADARGFSPIFVTAALSVLVLFAVAGWEMSQSLHAGNAPLARTEGAYQNSSAGQIAPPLPTAKTSEAATSSDPISNIGQSVMQQLEAAYEQMQQAGIYSTSTAYMVGQSLAPYVVAQVSYQTFSPGDLAVDRDTSYARMLRYREDLRAAFAPLLKNTTPEYEIFARYVETNDSSYLAELRDVAEDYRDAASNTAKVVVPADATALHRAILDAMEEFGAVLDALAEHASDPFASVALLRGYNQAEADMLTSFNALTVYYKSKRP